MENYIKKSHLVNFIVLTAVIFRCVNEALVDSSYLLLILLCFLGPRAIILSIFLLWLFYSLNSPLFPDQGYMYGFVRFIIIFLALILSFDLLPKNIIKRNFKVYFWLLIFVLFVFLQSFFNSPFIEVSILKILTWCSLFVLLMNCWSKIDKEEFYMLTKDLFFFFLLITISSLFLVNSHYGYVQNYALFQGILHHPQLFAIVMSLFSLMIITGFPYKLHLNIVNFLITIVALYLLFLSNGRTGILSLFLALNIYFLINPTFDHFRKKYTNTSKFIYFFLLSTLPFLIILIFQMNNILNIQFIQDVITKSGNTNEKLLIDAYLESRGQIFFSSFDNIINNFWSGIGFGIGSNLETFIVLRDPFFGIPYFGAVEKGLIFVAILEEIGIFGLIVFMVFILSCFFNLCESGFKSLPLFSLIIILNFGESTFFSTGGVGSLLLIFFTLSISKKIIKPI